MPLIMTDCVIANNGGAGIHVQGLRAAASLMMSLTRTSIHGNHAGGIIFDLSCDRHALGIPNSVPDADILRAAEIAKTNDRRTAFEKIKEIVSWGKLGIEGAEVIDRVISFIQR